MRYEKLEILLRVALDMRATAEGISLGDVQQSYGVSRRTAERMRDAIERVFPQLEQANPGEVPKRWRIRAGTVDNLVSFSAGELLALNTAADLARRENLQDAAARIDLLSAKPRSLLRPEVSRRVGPDLEAMTEAEGLALRPGPRQRISAELLHDLRQAIVASRKVTLHYRGRSTGVLSRQLVCPYGFLYGNQHYLLAYNLNNQARGFRLFGLANIDKMEVSSAPFRRQKNFSLRKFAEQSFGVFQEKAFDVVWKFTPKVAADARQFQFHPTQAFEDLPDGALIVRFRAGGLREMAWHLMTWGSDVQVLNPRQLKETLRQAVNAVGQGKAVNRKPSQRRRAKLGGTR